ncbi:MAG TPA: hypothetical protein VKG24_22395 [Pseudolabrys sp.]|nr:hypothetical protein [Pseudolabrys sp.]
MGEHENDGAWKYAEKSLAWSGWGSPIGLGFFIIALGLVAVLVRYAWAAH